MRKYPKRLHVFQNKATPLMTSRSLYPNAGQLCRSQFASGRSCDRPSWSRFSVVFLRARVNTELISKFHFTMLDSHADLPLLNKSFSLMQLFQRHYQISSHAQYTPPQIISPTYKKVHFLKLYPLHFLMRFPISIALLPDAWTGNW
jgi:hypothetical protein